MKPVATGAEAKLYLKKNKLVKDRIKKKYRLAVIDQRLRKRRTKAEAKLLQRAKLAGVPVPRVFDSTKDKIIMDYIKGKVLVDYLKKTNYRKLCPVIGKQIALLHEKGIIHGDLTTSNMVLYRNKIYFIDFGLGKFSRRIEDMATDLHLILKALESKHNKIYKQCFELIKTSYKKTFSSAKEVLNRLSKIEKRRRYTKK